MAVKIGDRLSPEENEQFQAVAQELFNVLARHQNEGVQGHICVSALVDLTCLGLVQWFGSNAEIMAWLNEAFPIMLGHIRKNTNTPEPTAN